MPTISVLIYRNNDEFFPGLTVKLTKGIFKTWVTFLDYLTEHLKPSSGAVHRVYDLNGHEIRAFKEFENGGQYVAAHGHFVRAKYGSKAPPKGYRYQADRQGGPLDKEPPRLASEDSIQLYLKKSGFKGDGDGWGTGFDLKKAMRAARSNGGAVAGNGMPQPTISNGQAPANTIANSTGRLSIGYRQQGDNTPTSIKTQDYMAAAGQGNFNGIVDKSNIYPSAKGNYYVDKSDPAWATQLTTAINQLSVEVQQLRSDGIKMREDWEDRLSKAASEYNRRNSQKQNSMNEEPAIDPQNQAWSNENYAEQNYSEN